jgi:hypothetical protein
MLPLHRRSLRVLLMLTCVLFAPGAAPWGPDGHRTVGALADRLIAGTHAQAQVRRLLGGLTLEQAAVWADCAKGVDPARDYAYAAADKYPECAPFETPAGEAAMIDYVRRNDVACGREPGSSPCHVRSHYTDVAIQRARYRPGDPGTRASDIVAATTAAIQVLQGRPAQGPLRIKDEREALLLLAHFAGDIAQPLHVGVVWLGTCGEVVDPPRHGVAADMDTQGGNRIATVRVATNHRSESLHVTWDDIPAALHADRIDAAWLALARAEPGTPGAMDGWSTQWADDSLVQARRIYASVGLDPQRCSQWTVALTGRDDDAMAPVKKRQLTVAGARLAHALMAIWP